MKTKLLVLGALFAFLCISAQGQLVDKTPVLHLSFDKVSGSTSGSIVTNTGSGGSAMNGTLNANGSGTLAIVPGRFGNGLEVSGATAAETSVRVANAVVPLNVGNRWTVAMWIKTSTEGGTYAYQGDGGWGGGNSTFYLNQGQGNTGTHEGGVRNGQGWEEGTNDVNDGLWHHVVITCNGNGTSTSKTLYLDGNVEGFQAAPGSYDGDGWSGDGTGGQFWFGGAGNTGDGTFNLNGMIDEVYVFNQTLSLSDIQALTNNTVPVVPATVTVSPISGYRGQVFTVTATATPAVGTVTNAVADLSALNLSATATMVQSSVNVFTNSFTVPNNAPVGARNVKVTVTSTEPLVGSGGATFTVLARPPTNAIIVTQLAPVSAYEYNEASFSFGTTNDAPGDAPFPMTYTWYTNSVRVSTNAMGARYTFLTTPGNNGVQVYAIARVADTNFSSIAVTSAVVTLTVNPGSVVYTNGLKEEFFGGGATRQDVEIGSVGPGVVRKVSQADSAGGFGDNTSRRYSGYFIPPTTDAYVFFVAGDDDTDVFLSTDSTPANKRLIAQEAGYSGTRNWQTAGGNGSTAGQKRSDQWSPDGGTTVPYSTGIILVKDQKYYFESVIHNGGGGDNWAVTYQTMAELALDSTQPVNGSASRMTAASNNIALVTFPGTTISWVTQPPASVSVYEGQNTNIVSLATSDAELVLNYQWYLNNTPIGGNTATLALNAVPFSYNGAQIKVVASTISGLSITSSVPTTLTVLQAVFEVGWVPEKKWVDTFNITGAENGTLGTPTVVGARPGFMVGRNNPYSGGGGGHDSSLQQIGIFIAPANGNYVFFITSHDGGNLFLSTNNTPAAKRLIAQEEQWANNWAWSTDQNGGNSAKKRSDTYSTDGGVTMPYSAGIPLVQGEKYYMEVTHTTSKWGNEQVGVYYSLMDEFNNVLDVPADGTLPNAIGTNVGMYAVRCTYVAFTQQPLASSLSTVEGGGFGFHVDGTSDSQYPIISFDGYILTQPTNTLFYQWYKILGGVTNAIPGATTRNLTTGPLTSADNGVKYFCAARALGYTDNALNPIWTNSQTTAAITVTGTKTPTLLGHFISGAADLNDTANYVAPGTYYGVPVRATTSSQYYYFTNDVPPGKSGVSLYLNAQAIAITNTCTSDPGYVVDTFDGTMASQFTVMCWAKGSLAGWNAFATKGGDNGIGWALRTGSAGGRACWTVRGSGGTEDMQGPTENDSNWHHYAGVYNLETGVRTLYVDGVVKGEYTGQTAYTPAAGHLTLGTEDLGDGNNFGNNGYITGLLYDVRIYNYALTQTQLITDGGVPPPFTADFTSTPGSLVLTWPLGTLLEATNLLGPWITSPNNASPATIPTTGPQKFFKVSFP